LYAKLQKGRPFRTGIDTEYSSAYHLKSPAVVPYSNRSTSIIKNITFQIKTIYIMIKISDDSDDLYWRYVKKC